MSGDQNYFDGLAKKQREKLLSSFVAYAMKMGQPYVVCGEDFEAEYDRLRQLAVEHVEQDGLAMRRGENQLVLRFGAGMENVCSIHAPVPEWINPMTISEALVHAYDSVSRQPGRCNDLRALLKLDWKMIMAGHAKQAKVVA